MSDFDVFVRAEGVAGWGVILTDRTRPKDLPEWFAPMFEHIQGAHPQLAFRGGRFFEVSHLPDMSKVEVEISPGSVLVSCDDGGVTVMRTAA